MASATGTNQNFDELIGHYFAACVIRDLLREGSFESLLSGVSAKQLAAELKVDEHKLELAVAYVASASNLLEMQTTGDIRLGAEYLNDRSKQFQLLKYLGAYSAVGLNTVASMRRGGLAQPNQIGEALFAEAYRRISCLRLSRVAEVVNGLPIGNLLELGCGSAPVLREVSLLRPDFIGWGFDSSIPMVELALESIARDGLQSQIEIKCASIEDVISDADFRGSVDAICLRSVLNAFFGNGDVNAIACLRSLRLRFPRAYIVVSDYYGRLNVGVLNSAGRRTLPHDFVQMLSGQGIPPSSDSQWRNVYRAAEYSVVQHFIDRCVPGITQFVDVLSVADVG